MCIAIFKPENVVLDEDTLKQCWKNNPHGAGFMYAEDSKLHVTKGIMDYREFREAYRPHQRKRVVLHFRIASIGAINEENTHPYIIRPGKLAFVHNGTIHKVGGVRGSGASDTSQFNDEYLKRLPPSFLKSDGMLWLIEDFVGKSRLIFMDNHGEVVIVNAESGEVENLVWYSNDSYKATITKHPANAQEWDEEKKTFITKKYVSSSNYGRGSHYGSGYGMDDDDLWAEQWMGCGYRIGDACGNNTRKALPPAPTPKKIKLTEDEQIVSLIDLTLSVSKGKWVIEAEGKEIPKMEQCINCGNALFHQVEFLVGVCGECETNLVCPNYDCDEDLTINDFMNKECGTCGAKLDLIQILNQDVRDPALEEKDPKKAFHEYVEATFPPEEVRGSEDEMNSPPTISRRELETLAEECQLAIIDCELGE